MEEKKEKNNKKSFKNRRNKDPIIKYGNKTHKYKENIENNNNYFNDEDNNNKLTNYFLFNLQREKMIDNQQSKAYIRPKTPKY